MFTELESMPKSQGDWFGDKVRAQGSTVHGLQRVVVEEMSLATLSLNSPLSLHKVANSATSPSPRVWTAQEGHHEDSSSKGASSLPSCTLPQGELVSNPHKGTLCQGHVQKLPWDLTKNGRAAWHAMRSFWQEYYTMDF